MDSNGRMARSATTNRNAAFPQMCAADMQECRFAHHETPNYNSRTL
jgi:hypothetical protein